MSWDDDKLLISSISTTNPDLGYYALRLVDIDAGRAAELTIADEARLGARVMRVGQRIRQRAADRDTAIDQPLPVEVSVIDDLISLAGTRLNRQDTERLVDRLCSALTQLPR